MAFDRRIFVQSSPRRPDGSKLTKLFTLRPWLILALAAAALGGCVNPSLVRVQPWQRATLADYLMNPDRDPLRTSQLEHVFSSREQASGGRGVGGSGCGCN